MYRNNCIKNGLKIIFFSNIMTKNLKTSSNVQTPAQAHNEAYGFKNVKTGRFNSENIAIKNGLFKQPTNFILPPNVGLNLVNKKVQSIAQLKKLVKSKQLNGSDVFLPGFLVLPISSVLVKINKAKTKKYENETIQFNKVSMFHVKVDGFKGVAQKITIYSDEEFKDVIVYKDAVKKTIFSLLSKHIKEHGALKTIFTLNLGMRKPTDFLDDISEHSFSSGAMHKNKAGEFNDTSIPIVAEGDIDRTINDIFDIIKKRIEEYAQNGSGWVIENVNNMVIKTVKFKPFKGGSYIPLPDWIQNKKCCINVENKDNRCFEYSILSALYSETMGHSKRVSSYSKYINTLNFDGIEFPVSSMFYEAFENQNEMPINVFSVNAEGVQFEYDVEYINKLNSSKQPINILRVYNSENSHYVWIKNINAFIKTKDGTQFYCCSRCLQRFTRSWGLNKHTEQNKCIEFRSEAIKALPLEGKHICEFNNIHKQMRAPFVIYADCESALKPVDIQKGKNTTIYQSHQVLNVGCKLVSQYPDVLHDEYKQFDGEDCMTKFLEYILKIQDKAYKIVKNEKEMIISKLQEQEFKKAANCHICNKELGEDRVRDHDHITGLYRGPAHNNCNINYCIKKFQLPIIFHNLKGYDSHLILQFAGLTNRPISCIPNTMEKYLSFTLDKCVFLDSLQFTLSSLEALVSNLNKVGDESIFSTFNEEFTSATTEVKQLLRQKGVFPYDWYSGVEKWGVTALPSKDDFFSVLADAGIKDEDYKRAQEVWVKSGCTTFKDYLSLYLKTDVLLLADVFEAFRNMCNSYYGLDPCHYFTAPGFSWDSMLKMTEAKIECFQEGQLDMLQMVQSGMRGGISMITTRHAKANIKDTKDYDATKPLSSIMYLDANNLYGWAMSQALPLGNYKWEVKPSQFTPEFIESLKDDDEKGYILECDIDVPESLHDYFNDYPLAPESTSFDASPFIQEKYKSMIKVADNTKKIESLKARLLVAKSKLTKLENEVKAVQSCEWIKVKNYSEHRKGGKNYESLRQLYIRVINWASELLEHQKIGARDASAFINNNKNIEKIYNEMQVETTARRDVQDVQKVIQSIEDQIENPNKINAIKKLVPNLCNKRNYVLHYRNLKLYLQLGLILKKVHRVISFTQSTYLKQYIDFNTSKRAQSKNDFEKDLFKLFNNAIFGKTCENVDKRIEVQLVSEPKKFVNQASKPYFKDFRIFSNNLVACEMRKTQVKYNRPMIVGMCILDLSKVLMYDFHYNTMVKTYGTKAKLCFTDTDSLTYHIETPSFYEDMKKDLSNFDTSDYPKDHLCYSEANMKIIGKFKDETNAVPILEFIGLRAKMYSIKLSEFKSKATAKGIKKSVTKALKHEKYSDAIFGTTNEELRQTVSFNLIRSQNHQVNTIKINKVGLCAYDDKRYILEDNINSYAHGHHMIKQ